MDVQVQMKINYTTTINMLHTVRNGLLLFGDAEVMNVWTAKVRIHFGVDHLTG